MAEPIRAVVLDIEGTTTPIAFVHRVLFPYARDRLPALLRDRAAEPGVAAALEAVPGPDPLATLLDWLDRDVKVTPLKTLQGLVWREGYTDGTLLGELYGDVAPALAAWHAAGLRLFIYSSGSEDAQRLLFGHSDAGNLLPLLSGFFDTRIGAKRDAESYRAILAALGEQPARVLFLSDVEAELLAASEAGLTVCQVARPEDGTLPSPHVPVADTFATVGRRFGLG